MTDDEIATRAKAEGMSLEAALWTYRDRWVPPIPPPDRAPGPVELELARRGFAIEHEGASMARSQPLIERTRYKVDGDMLFFVGLLVEGLLISVWVPRWPAKDGKYGWGAASPQYAIRLDHGRYELEEIIKWLMEFWVNGPQAARSFK